MSITCRTLDFGIWDLLTSAPNTKHFLTSPPKKFEQRVNELFSQCWNLCLNVCLQQMFCKSAFHGGLCVMGKSSVTSNLCNTIIVWTCPPLPPAGVPLTFDYQHWISSRTDNLNLDQFVFFAANKQDTHQWGRCVPDSSSSTISQIPLLSTTLSNNQHLHHLDF